MHTNTRLERFAPVRTRLVNFLIALLCCFASTDVTAQNAQGMPAGPTLLVPLLETPAVIDGDLDDWRDYGFNDGIWDINRIRHQPWYEAGRRNRLTYQNPGEPHPDDDLRARYYIAWDTTYLYLGAEVVDNMNDIEDPAHADRRWMFKDAICWFVEAPRDAAPEWFGRGDNAFCFVIDESKPDWGAWWRYGTPTQSYQEAPIPPGAVDYEVRMTPDATGAGNFVLEARVAMQAVFPISDPHWQTPFIGAEYGLEIVHTDPDGGDYGGHFMIYGTGDDDSTWGRMIFTGPQKPVERLEN